MPSWAGRELLDINPNTLLTSLLALLGTAVVGYLAHWGTSRVKRMDDTTAIRKELWLRIDNLEDSNREKDEELDEWRENFWQCQQWLWTMTAEARRLGSEVQVPDIGLQHRRERSQQGGGRRPGPGMFNGERSRGSSEGGGQPPPSTPSGGNMGLEPTH